MIGYFNGVNVTCDVRSTARVMGRGSISIPRSPKLNKANLIGTSWICDSNQSVKV